MVAAIIQGGVQCPTVLRPRAAISKADDLDIVQSVENLYHYLDSIDHEYLHSVGDLWPL